MTERNHHGQSLPPRHRVRVTDPAFDRSEGFHDTRQHRLQFYRGDGRRPLLYSADEIALLPTTADNFFNNELKVIDWERILKVILIGVRDEMSSLVMLRDHESTLVREIYSFVDSRKWAKHVKLTIPAGLVGRQRMTGRLMQFHKGRGRPECYDRRLLDSNISVKSSGYDSGFISFARCGRVKFPPPAGRNVNMMPFIFGAKDSLPDNLKSYYPLIEQCPYMADEIGKVGFLTVHESYVYAGDAQRREGLHIESPGVFSDDKVGFTPGVEHGWGMGVCFGPDRYEGGIFMSSSVDNTSEVWDALVNKTVPGIVDEHGGCEHLRGLLGKSTKLEAGELIWMTDCTPHEAIPQETSGHRQFFRVVTPYVTHWYAEHSTTNPKVSLPPNIIVIKGNKFKIHRQLETSG